MGSVLDRDCSLRGGVIFLQLYLASGESTPKSKTIVKPQRVLYPVGKKGVKLTRHSCVSNESLLLPFLNAQKPSLLESFLDQHKAHLFGLLLGCESGFQSFFPVS